VGTSKEGSPTAAGTWTNVRSTAKSETPTAAGTLATAGWTAAEKTFCGKKCRPFVKIM